MIITVKNEAPWQILSNAMTISPSSTGYDLQVSANGKDYSTLFSVGAGITRQVTNLSSGSYFRMLGNIGEVVVNWVRDCSGGGGGGGADYTPGEYIDIQNNVISVTGITPDEYLTTADTQDFATKEFVTGATEEIYETMETKEEVVASALTELDARIIEISGNTPDLTNYYTKAETDAEITAATQNFVTEADITAATSPIQTQLDDVERVTATALTELHQDILDLSGSTSEFVTSGDVATQISAATEDIFEIMETKEEVIAAALVDLDGRIPDMSDYYTSAQTQNAITAATQGFVTSGDVSTQISTATANMVESTTVSTIWTGTQAQYDLIANPDPNTLYIIKNN